MRRLASGLDLLGVGRGLAPPSGNPKRGPYYRWLFFAAGPVEAAVTAKSLGLLAPADKKAMAGYGSFEEAIDCLEVAVRDGPYICGEQFTAADVYVGSQIGWGMMFGTIDKRPAFEDRRPGGGAPGRRRRRTADDPDARLRAASGSPLPGL